MRSEYSVEERAGSIAVVVSQTQATTTQQFVDDIGQTVANELFGYATGNGNIAAANHIECCVDDVRRPKRKTRKMQQVQSFANIHTHFIRSIVSVRGCGKATHHRNCIIHIVLCVWWCYKRMPVEIARAIHKEDARCCEECDAAMMVLNPIAFELQFTSHRLYNVFFCVCVSLCSYLRRCVCISINTNAAPTTTIAPRLVQYRCKCTVLPTWPTPVRRTATTRIAVAAARAKQTPPIEWKNVGKMHWMRPKGICGGSSRMKGNECGCTVWTMLFRYVGNSHTHANDHQVWNDIISAFVPLFMGVILKGSNCAPRLLEKKHQPENLYSVKK